MMSCDHGLHLYIKMSNFLSHAVSINHIIYKYIPVAYGSIHYFIIIQIILL